MEQLADVVPTVQVFDLPVAQEEGTLDGDQLVALLKHLDKPIPVQAIEVPKKSKSSRLCFVPEFCFVPMEQQTAEQLVEVPTTASFSSLQRTAEQRVDIPGAGRRPGSGGGLQSLHPGQDSTAFGGAVHVDIPVPQGRGGGGGLHGLRPGQGSSASSSMEKINEIYLQLPLFVQNAARIENCVQTLAQTVAAQTTKIANIEQIVGSLVARVTSLETIAASASSSPDSTRSWNILGHSDGSTATGSLGPHGPGSSDDNRNTRRRIDTSSSPENEQPRSAVLLRFHCEQFHKGTTQWIDNLWEESNMPANNKPVRIHCKASSVWVRLVFETRAKCQDFIARYKDDGIPYEINSPCCCANTNIVVRQSNSIENRELGKQFEPLWRELADQLKVLFPDGDDEGAFIIPALDARSHTLSIKDRRNGIGKPVFKLAPLGSGQTFVFITHPCCT